MNPSNSKRNSLISMFGVAALLVGLYFLNQYHQDSLPPEQGEVQRMLAAAGSTSAPATAAKTSGTQAPATAPAAPKPAAPANPSLASLPEELMIGNFSAAKTKVTVGYTFDADTAENAGPALAVVNAVKSWQASHPDDAAAIVCFDIPMASRTQTKSLSVPIGVVISGSVNKTFPDNPGEGKDTASAVTAALAATQ